MGTHQTLLGSATDLGHFGCNVTETAERHVYALRLEEDAERFGYYQHMFIKKKQKKNL